MPFARRSCLAVKARASSLSKKPFACAGLLAALVRPYVFLSFCVLPPVALLTIISYKVQGKARASRAAAIWNSVAT